MLFSAVIGILTILIGFNFKATLPFLALLFVFMLTFTIYKKGKSAFIIALIFPILIVLSLINEVAKIDNLSTLDGIKTECEFTVIDITYESDGYYVAEIVVNSCDKLKSGTKLNMSYYKNNLTVGSIAKGSLRLKKFHKDQQLIHQSKQIYLNSYCSDYTVYKEKQPILNITNRVRSYITKALFSKLGSDEAATMTALCFGERKYFSDEFYENVKGAGVSHVMVVSGMHLSILVSFFTLVSDKYFYNKYLKAFIMLAVVVVLTFLCGFTMSIIRAGVMYSLTAFGTILNRKSDPSNTLGATVTLILTATPLSIFDISFLLSTLSTFGILSISIPICNFLTQREIIKHKTFRTALFALLTSFSATLLTLPITIYFFGYISVFGVIATLLISYAVTLVICLCVSALFLNLIFPFVSNFVFIICDCILKYVNFVINKIGSQSFSVIYSSQNYTFVSIFIIILIFSLLLTCKQRLDMLKLKEIRRKIISEGGGKLRWR